MTTITTYTAQKAERLIRRKKAEGEYHVTGSLDLRGCDLSGVTLPTSVGGWLDLSGCDLSGVTLPTSVGGWLDLSGCRNPDPSQWWTECGETTRRRCIAVCPKGGYALIQTDTDLFSADCQRNLTRERALAHWSRSDARAKLFTAAIEASIIAALGEAG